MKSEVTFIDIIRKLYGAYYAKKEKFLSRMRFSLTFRIAVNYSRMFIIFGLVIILLFGLMFMMLFYHECGQKMDDVKQRVIEAAGDDYKNADFSEVNVYREDGLELRILEASTRTEIYSDTEDKLNKKANVLDKVFVEGKGSGRQTILYTERIVRVGYRNTDEISLRLEYRTDISKQMNFYIKNIKIMFLIIVLISIIMSVSGARQMKFLMSPIEQMSKAAEKLTVYNLDKERLNTTGTKNELKDLAETINKMLDRIDISYENQKQFVSNASHELRTPIAVIQGYVNMVDRWGKEDPDVMDESIQAIKEEAANMKELVEKLLFLSRNDKNTLKLSKTYFNMKEIADELAKETVMVADKRNIIIGAMEDVMVYGDRQSLKQAVRILIDNAIKYSRDDDSITLTCKNNNGECTVTVEDTGIGMKENDIGKVFERFYRSEDVRDKSITGHGLGLSIAKLIVIKHTGTIRVRSQYGKGTVFSIILPRIYI